MMGKRTKPPTDTELLELQRAVVHAPSGGKLDALHRLKQRKHDGLRAFVRVRRTIKRVSGKDGA